MSSPVPHPAISDMGGMTHCIPKLPPAREAHGASAQTFFRKDSRHTWGGTKETRGRGCCGETAGDTVMEKKLHGCWGTAALGGPTPERGSNKKQGSMEENE